MSIDFAAIAVPQINGLHPYRPGKPLDELEHELGLTETVNLASNENPLGPGRLALESMRASLEDVTRYPDGGGFALKSAIAVHLNVAPETITLGNGSNDVLDLIARVFLGPGRGAVFSQYAFAVYPISTQSVGAKAQIAPAHPPDHLQPYGHNLCALADVIDDTTRVVFIANPNNPTGTWLRRRELEDFIGSVPYGVLVVVDEAYFEYVEDEDYPDCSRWLDRFPNLIVTRTFSKLYGLAGLRVGYGLSHPAIAELLNRARQPFNVNSIAQVGAIAALQDIPHAYRIRELNRNGLKRLAGALDTQGLAYIPSVANFITVDVGRPAESVYLALLRKGVLTRPLANYALPNHLRVSVGTDAETNRFLDALKEVLSAGIGTGPVL